MGDLINERDMSLESRGCSCTETSSAQTYFLYEHHVSLKNKHTNKQTNIQNLMPAAKNKPHVKQEKRVCLHIERERKSEREGGDKAIEKNRQCERACSIPLPWQQ